MFILDPHGSARAINISQAQALYVMPMGADGKGKPSIVAGFFNTEVDGDAYTEDLAIFETEATAHAALAMFVTRLQPSFNPQILMENIKEELEEKHRKV